MFGLTYDLWKEIIHDIAVAHDPLFAAMHQAADELQLSPALIDDLKKRRELQIADDPWDLRLIIEFIEDMIGGFTIYLAAVEQFDVLEQIKADIASDQGFSQEDMEGFELEHGLDMDEEIFVEMEDIYKIRAEVKESEIIYELVVFDSQDIDDSRQSDLAWQEYLEN